MMLTPEALREWVEGSGVNEAIAGLNVESLEGYAPFECLFYSEKIQRLNTGRLPGWILKRYAHLENGGWWCSGVNLLSTDNEGEDWGCFKPVSPRVDVTKGKLQKYEHPLKAIATLFALRVPVQIWEKVSKRYGVPMPENIAVTENGEALGFWQWVIVNPQVHVILTEGCKKAAALLSLGFAAIGLPGIWGGYRKNDGQPSLLPHLELFTQGDRRFYFAFDQDEKRKTRQANRKALWCTAKLLKDKGCQAYIVQWEPWIKGCDDLIVAKGGNHFLECYSKALSFDDWQADSLKELSYKPALRLDTKTKYIGEFSPPPGAKLICLQAPKGSGKTEWLVKLCAEAQSVGQKVLVLTHRQQLGQALCSRFGIDYVSELKDSDTKGCFGFGLCFDSLRRNSQARFNPDDWHGCIVILDECEQSIWHLLSARTEVAKHRVEVLRNFQELIQNTLESDEGKVYLSDADLSDLSIDYIRSLANFPVEPWVAVKEGNPTPWNVTVWETCNELLGALVSHIRVDKGKPLIFVDGQKTSSKWGTQNLESYLAKLFPDLRILRIDAESIADPNHPAFGCIDKLNQVLPLYDVAIASPSIETGVSIDIKGHITSVWDIAQGVVPVPSILQRMARLRESVPRHMWAKGFGIGRIANGSTSPRKLMSSQQTQFKAHIKLLAESEFPIDFETASSFQPQAIRTWAKMAARINLGMVRYQHEVLRALVAEGHSVNPGNYLEVLAQDQEAVGTDKIKDDLTESRDKIYEEHCLAVAEAPTPDEKQYETLSKKQARTKGELKELRKGDLSRRYPEELVSSELVKLDDEGEYPKARLHYYLTTGRDFLPTRDKQAIERQLESGQGELFLPDVNRSLVGGKIKCLEALNIKELFAPDVEWSNDSQILIDLSIKSRQYKDGIKTVLGISITEKDSPVAIAQKFLRQCLGLAFSTPIKRGAKGNQQRFYQPVEVPELRQKILEGWLARDEAAKLAQQQEATSPSTVSENGGLGLVPVEACRVTVGSTGNIYRSPVLPTESAAYQSEVSIEGELRQQLGQWYEQAEVVEEVIAAQDTQPQRQRMSRWHEAAKVVEEVIASTPVLELEPVVGSKIRVSPRVAGSFRAWQEGVTGVVKVAEPSWNCYTVECEDGKTRDYPFELLEVLELQSEVATVEMVEAIETVEVVPPRPELIDGVQVRVTLRHVKDEKARELRAKEEGLIGFVEIAQPEKDCYAVKCSDRKTRYYPAECLEVVEGELNQSAGDITNNSWIAPSPVATTVELISGTEVRVTLRDVKDENTKALMAKEEGLVGVIVSSQPDQGYYAIKCSDGKNRHYPIDCLEVVDEEPKRQQVEVVEAVEPLILAQTVEVIEPVEVLASVQSEFEEYQPGQEVWAYFPQSRDKWLKGVVEWVRGNTVRVKSGFFGVFINHPEAIAPGDWVMSG